MCQILPSLPEIEPGEIMPCSGGIRVCACVDERPALRVECQAITSCLRVIPLSRCLVHKHAQTPPCELRTADNIPTSQLGICSQEKMNAGKSPCHHPAAVTNIANTGKGGLNTILQDLPPD